MSPLADAFNDDVMSALIDNAGPIAMLFVVLIAIALFFLFRSMKRQLKRVDENFPSEPPSVDGNASTE